MKTKLNRSNIQISGRITISPTNNSMDNVVINLEGLKQAKSGIYEIRNKFNNKRYIGKSEDLIARKKHHWFDLIRGIHKSKEMQADYDKYTVGGNDAKATDISPDNIFEFNVIHYCYSSELEFWERILIDNLYPEYNTKKKKQIPPKKFDIDGNRIKFEYELSVYEPPTNYWESKSDDDCEEEMM